MTDSSNAVGISRSAEDGYVVVARRYRPKDFDQLVGQDHVAKALQGAIETSRVGHAYLFTGARGVGKTSTARIFAKALNDPGGPTAHPASQSDVAQAIDAGEDVDVIEIDGASNRGIDEIRSLRANVGVRPSRSRYKIYIIDEVHMLTGAAFNALLKTLEEPPEHVKFIFCTTDPEKIPITVLSRCQRFDFAPVESDKIVGRLREIVEAENGTAEPEALELLARRAAGSMRDSQSLLEQVLSFSDGNLTADKVHAMLGTADDQRLHALAEVMSTGNAADALRQIDAAIAAGIDAGRLTEQMLGYFRDLMAVAVGCDASLLRYAAASMHHSLQELANRWGLQTVLAIVGMIDETLVRIRLSVHARVLLESTVIQICSLPDLQAIADLTAAASRSTASAATNKPAVLSEKKNVPVTASKPTESIALSTPTATQIRVDPAAHRPQGQHAALPAMVAVANGSIEKQIGAPEILDDTLFQKNWPQILSEMDPIASTLVKAAARVHVSEPGTVRMLFPAGAALALNRCGKAEHRVEIIRAISRVTGRDVTLLLDQEVGTAKATTPQPVSKAKNRMQRMREIETNSLVRAAVELLGAEIVKIDTPRA